ncbi:hypothetical protein K503DRAFT_768131 [Rhizopogon vinicolor AM-OR11-026]|uniref:Uncharacterized protein n=1 Tax=Rhizopogon vinicolor AM-OR11-026 TaxID=1314800 RepID=A0A1B7N7X7_9AGAM|nr:hypothetical protein K503DRAFT_768131 [Rhizopogon vinicolor AM-OR11-026]
MLHHTKSFSIISAQTDFEICAVADLLSHSLSHARSYAEEQERIGVAVDDSDDVLDPSNIIPVAGKSLVTPYLLLEHEEPLSPSFRTDFPANSCPPSESEYDISSDDHYSPYAPSTSSYPVFHLPRRSRTHSHASNGHISASDSDTPSLSSSTTSFSSQSYSTSPPISPDTLKTPIDHLIANHYLTIIEERAAEDQEMGGRRLSQSSGSNSFASTEYRASLRKPFIARSPDPRPKGRVFNVDHLRLNVPPPALHFPSLATSSTFDPSPPSSATFSPPSSPYASTAKSSLSRFLPGGMRSGNTNTTSSLENAWSTSPTASVVTSRTARREEKESKEEKTRKAAEKKRNKAEAKAEAKARVERLAEELKERQRRHAATFDRQSVHSHRSFGRSRRHWDEDRSMYDGLAAL